MKRTTTLSIDIAGTEIEVEIEFTVSPYIPEQGPSYASGGQPAEGGEVEILSATLSIEGKWCGLDTVTHTSAPDWLVNILASNDAIIDRLRDAASQDDDGPDPDAAYERMRDGTMSAADYIGLCILAWGATAALMTWRRG